MADRVVSFSIKPRDQRSIELIKEVKKTVIEQNLPSFSYVMLKALSEYMEKHHDRTN